MSRSLLLCGLLAISSACFAQISEFVEPCVLDSDGEFLGIAWKTRGGHRIVFDDEKRVGFTPFSFTLSLFGNDGMYERLKGAVGTPKKSFGGSMIRTVAGGGILIPQVDTTSGGSNFQEFSMSSTVFPGGDSGKTEPRGVLVSGNVTGRELDFPRRITAEMIQAVRRQKPWQCSAFRVSIGTLPTENVLRFEPIEVQRVPTGDLDGDGLPDFIDVAGDFVFDVPRAASGPYRELFQATLDGKPVELPLRIEYHDENGVPVLTLSSTVIVRGWNPTKVTLDVGSPQNSVTVHTKIKRELLIERERKG